MDGGETKKKTLRDYLFLHGVLLFYSLITALTKYSAGYETASVGFWLLFGAKLACLGIYALLWREVLKRFTLTGAFLHKTVTVIWGLVMGVLMFSEELTWQKAAGSLLIMGGLFLAAEEEKA